MVRLATVQSGFEAKVLAARLGAEGIVWELRGAVDGPYPMGPVTVLVEEHELDVARELLLVDEVESSFDDADGHLARSAVLRMAGDRRGGGGRHERAAAGTGPLATVSRR